MKWDPQVDPSSNNANKETKVHQLSRWEMYYISKNSILQIKKVACKINMNESSILAYSKKRLYRNGSAD